MLSSACVLASAQAFQSPDPNGDRCEERWDERGQGVYLQLSKHHHGTFLTRIIIVKLLMVAAVPVIVHACVPKP
jgi:hypothetical protein